MMVRFRRTGLCSFGLNFRVWKLVEAKSVPGGVGIVGGYSRGDEEKSDPPLRKEEPLEFGAKETGCNGWVRRLDGLPE